MRGLLRAFVVLGWIGGAILGLLLFVLPVVLIFKHNWPWFHPEASLVQNHPASTATLTITIGLLVVALGIRLVKTPQSVIGGIVVSTILWYLHAHTALGTASYFIFSWIIGLGGAAIAIYVVASFLGGLSPGFVGVQSLLLYLVYHDARLITLAMLPAAIGEIIDACVSRVAPED